MRRSKLEIYEEIIFALAAKALNIDELAFECSTNCVLLQERLDFLADAKIISVETNLDNRTLYVLTRRGVAISKTLALTRRLEKLQNSQTSVQGLNLIPKFADDSEEEIRRRL